jgi:hypothetical protein
MKKPACVGICLILCMLRLSGQLQFASWPGSRGRVSFAGGAGVFLSDIPAASYYARLGYIGGPPVAYCHPATGQPLLVSNGSYVFNSNYDTISNSGLISCGFDRYQVQFLPRPGFPRQIYVFTQYSGVGYITGLETGLQTRCSQQNQIGLYYTLIDLDLNGGLGGVVEKNVKLPFYGMYDCLAFVKHPSGQDYWLVSRANSSSMGAVRLSPTGFGALIPTSLGLGIGGDSYMLRCNITASPNGRVVALSTAGRPSYVFLYDFDPATGTFANYRFQWLSAQTVTGLAFSPDNSKLYVTTAIPQPCDDEARLYQLDFNEANPDSSLHLVHSKVGYSYGEMQRGPDNAIWMGPDWHGFGRVFHGIRFPNQPKAACLYQDVRLDLGQDDYTYIPINVPSDYISQQPENQANRLGMPEEMVLCDNNMELTAPPGYGAYQWNTGETTRSITPQGPGSYWVIAWPAGFDRPTAYGVTTVRQGGAPISLVKDTTACPGATPQLTIHSYFTQISWSDGDTSHKKQVLPPGGKIYVTAIDPSGCRSWDSTCVNFHYFPRAEFGPHDTVLCAGQSLTLRMEYDFVQNAPPPAIAWSTGSTASSITVSQPGTYWGTISQNGCTSTDTIQVAVASSTVIGLGADTTLCQGETIKLHTSATGVQHLWSTGSTSDTLVVSQPGQYWVKVFTPACTVSDTITIQYANSPEQPFPSDTAFCQGQSA